MSRRHTNKRRTRLASDLRWWLHHYAGCTMCWFDMSGEFSRVSHARSSITYYLERASNPDPRPVRIPRRFWKLLGRFVLPQT